MHYFQVRIENQKDNSDAPFILDGRWQKNKDEAVKYYRENFINVNWFRLPKDVKVYKLVEAEYVYGGKERYVYSKFENAIKKSDFEAMNFVKVDTKYERLVYQLELDFIKSDDHLTTGSYEHELYISEENEKILLDAISTKQKAYVIKGTDFPFWFKVGGKLLPSETSNWFINLYEKYGIIDEASLEEYKGKPATKK